jgi:hypothetical protein
MRMVQRRGNSSLAQEALPESLPLGELWLQHFNSYLSAKAHVACKVYARHTAFTQPPDELI